MDFENYRCIDCGSKFCPCPLAENNQCILCNQARGEKFCNCQNWNGVCIYSELLKNGGKAKKGRATYKLKIKAKKLLKKDFLELKIYAPLELLDDLKNPGSFVFLRSDSEDIHYDTPISIVDVNMQDLYFTVVYEIRGIKTKRINRLSKGDDIYVKGPFWNGVLGVDHINNLKDSSALLICRGIAIAPTIPVIKKLISNNTKVKILMDTLNIEKEQIKEYLSGIDVDIEYISVIDGDKISDNFKERYLELIESSKYKLCCISAPDFIITSIMNMAKDAIKYACCNNAKMCCGSGICGSCTAKFDNRKVKRLCKVQVEPKFIFEGRWLL